MRTPAQSPKSPFRVLSPKRANLSSVFEDDSGSANGSVSVYSSGIGHDDPTEVMGNVRYTRSQLSMGTIATFLTTEHDRDAEAREPYDEADESNMNSFREVDTGDLSDQLYELDQAANSWTTKHSQVSGDSSEIPEIERFYVNEAGNNSSPRVWKQTDRKLPPETIEEQSEWSNVSETEYDEEEADKAHITLSTCLQFEPQVFIEDSKNIGYISSDHSRTSAEQASSILSVLSDESQNEETNHDNLGVLRAASSEGSASQTSEIVRQVQKLLLESSQTEPGTETTLVDTVEETTVKLHTATFQGQRLNNHQQEEYVSVIDEEMSLHDCDTIDPEGMKSTAQRRRLLLFVFLCLIFIVMFLALLATMSDVFNRSNSHAIITPDNPVTSAPTQHIDDNPNLHPTSGPVDSVVDVPTLVPDTVPSISPVEKTLTPSAKETLVPASTLFPGISSPPTRFHTQNPDLSLAPTSFEPRVDTKVPSLSSLQPQTDTLEPSMAPIVGPTSLSLTVAPGAGTTPPSNSNEFDAKAHLRTISGDLLDDPTTPQYEAYQWLITDDPANLDLSSISVKTLEQRYIAALLYFSTQGNTWENTYNFMTEIDVCEWKDAISGKGISCDSQGTIEDITINQNGLRGSIPFELQALTSIKRLEFRTNKIGGSVPPELGSLVNLEEFDLRQNILEGSFPASIFGLPKLKKLLMLQNVNLGGTIPGLIENATNLEMMSFQRCKLSGSLPSGLGVLSRLYFLTLLGNEMTGSIPAELTKLPNLEVLELAGNNFTSSIPEFSDQPGLYFISLFENQLTGTMPESLGRLTSLLFFDARDNELSGRIPSSINNLPELVTFYAAGNQLTGPLPNFSENIGFLQSVDLARNQLSGDLEEFLSPRGPTSELHTINLAANLLSGSIPSTIGKFTRLASLVLTDNQISGTIPSTIGDLQKLDTLLLNRNKLRGTVPGELGQLGGLKYVDMSDNLFEGTITDSLGTLSRLSILDLSRNNFSGTLPDALENLGGLDELYLQSNNFTGDLDVVLCPGGDSSGLIGKFVADCGEPNPEVVCSCCTACCSDTNGCMST